jgi:dTDP-L-rhamnose 4-epimerase
MRDARTDFEAWNVGSGVGCTVTELAERLARALGRTVAPRVSGAFRVGDYRHLVLDTTKLTELGFVPQTPLDAGLERFARWLVAQSERA